MTSRLIQALLALSLLLNTFVLVGFVYSSWIAPPMFERHMPPPPPLPSLQQGPRPSPVEALMNDLVLDTAQREALGKLLESYGAARRERYREIQKVREQTVAELSRAELDMARIDGLIDRTTRLRAEQWKESLHTVAQFEPQLRPEQRERLRVLLAERFAGAPPPPRSLGVPGVPGGPPAPGGPGPGSGRPPK